MPRVRVVLVGHKLSCKPSRCPHCGAKQNCDTAANWSEFLGYDVTKMRVGRGKNTKRKRGKRVQKNVRGGRRRK